MIDIMKTSDTLCRKYMQSLLEEKNYEIVIEVLLECKDKLAQKNVARVVRYLLCKMKMIEKADIQSDAKENYADTFTDTDGKEHTLQKERPKALTLRFLDQLLSGLSARAATNWQRFEYYLELLLAYALYSPEELENTEDKQIYEISHNKEGEAYQIGTELYK